MKVESQPLKKANIEKFVIKFKAKCNPARWKSERDF